MEHRHNEETTPLLKPPVDDDPILRNQKKFPFRQYLLELIFFLYMSAYNLGDYISYGYMYKYGSEQLHYTPNKTNDSSQCNVDKNTTEYQLHQEVEAFASSWQLYFSLASGIPSLLTGVVYGTYSDRIGRRFIVLLSVLSVCCRLAAYAIAVQWNLSMYYVLPGYILEGLGGSYITMFLASAAYTADVTKTGDSRTLRLTLVFVVGGLSDAVSFAAFGYTINGLGYRDTFLLVIGLFGLTLLCVVFLPETRSGKHMKKMTFRQYVYRAVRFYVEDSSSNPNRYVYILASLSLAMALLATTQRSAIELLYLLDSPFCWSNVFIGNFQAISRTSQRIVSLFCIWVLLKCTTEEVISVLFGVFVVASITLEAFAKDTVWMYIVAVFNFPNIPFIIIQRTIVSSRTDVENQVAVFNFPNIPFIIIQRTIVSSRTDVENQGALFASIQFLESVCNMAGTSLCNLVYSSTVDVMTGAVFLYMAALAAISTAFLIILVVMITKRKKTPHKSTIVIQAQEGHRKEH